MNKTGFNAMGLPIPSNRLTNAYSYKIKRWEALTFVRSVRGSLLVYTKALKDY